MLQFDGSFILKEFHWSENLFIFGLIWFYFQEKSLSVSGFRITWIFFFFFGCCSLILKRWGTFGAVLCDLASGCHLRISICSDNRTKTWSRCVRVYPCRVYSSECWWRRLTLFGAACFPRVRVWRTVFTPSRRECRLFWNFYLNICSAERKELYFPQFSK